MRFFKIKIKDKEREANGYAVSWEENIPHPSWTNHRSYGESLERVPPRSRSSPSLHLKSYQKDTQHQDSTETGARFPSNPSGPQKWHRLSPHSLPSTSEKFDFRSFLQKFRGGRREVSPTNPTHRTPKRATSCLYLTIPSLVFRRTQRPPSDCRTSGEAEERRRGSESLP